MTDAREKRFAALLQGDASTREVYNALDNLNDVYDLCTKLTLTLAMRAKLIAGLWAKGKDGRVVLAKIMEKADFAHPATLKKAAELLDTPRKIRQLEARLENGGKPKRQKRDRDELMLLQTENVPMNYSASRCFNKILRTQLGKVPADRLEFDLLFFSDGPWKTLCDLAHPAPSTFQLPFFQDCTFGAPAPEGSLLADARSLDAGNLVAVMERHPRLAKLGYSYVRDKMRVGALAASAKAALARLLPLGDIVWWYEELRDRNATDDIVKQRLQQLEPGAALEASSAHFNTSNFAKIAERLLTFRKLNVSFWELLMPLAERLLNELKARRAELVRRSGVPSLQAPLAELTVDDESVARPAPTAEPALKVAVLGDASASMQTAINSACVAGAMMTAIFEADLIFFNNKAFRALCHPMPSTTEQVLQVTEEVRANCPTSPAAALGHFHDARKAVDLFLVVTDEAENTPYKGMRFAPLFKKYRQQVNSEARCIFVSFLRDRDPGTMVRELERVGIEAKQYRFDLSRPDLAKFDAILSSILVDAQHQLNELTPRLAEVAAPEQPAEAVGEPEDRKSATSTAPSEWELV